MNNEMQFLNCNEINISIERISKVIYLSPGKTEVYSSPKKIFHFKYNGNQVVYILVAGKVELCNTRNKIIIAEIKHPAVLLSGGEADVDHVFIRTASDVILHRIDLINLYLLVEKEGLWRHMAMIFAWYLEIYSSREYFHSSTNNSYSLVKFYLESLWNNNKEGLEYISIFDFILSRTTISRSNLNKILHDLSKGGYIKIKRGKLIQLNKLPERY